MKSHKSRTVWWRSKIVFIIVASTTLTVLLAGGLLAYDAVTTPEEKQPQHTRTAKQAAPSEEPAKDDNPLAGRSFYVDASRQANVLAAEYESNGQATNAELMKRVSSQPGAVWLNGPTASDPAAAADIAAVERTSKEAASQGTVPVYQLYAIPNRDACAAYSKGGFRNSTDYLAWVDKIIAALHTEAVFSVEADAIAHTIKNTCLTPKQINDRYALIKDASAKLSQSSKVLGVYLDAGHSDWITDPSVLVEPLRKSGIEHARGIVVNVSFFAETSEITRWSQQLVEQLGGGKGVIIDTSRNGKGIAQVSGDARWCNPAGRGLGPRPTSEVTDNYIDAYVWIKTVGQSDGACAGNPPAGTFVPALALELARNAIE